jgi:polysaccharide biosynthesis transport protein
MTPSDPKRLPPPPRQLGSNPDLCLPPSPLMPVGPAIPAIGVPLLQPGGAADTSAEALLQAFRRRWLLALSSAIAAAAVVGLGVFYLWPSKYTATTLVHVSSRPNASFFGGGAWESNEDFTLYVRTQSARLKSKPVLAAALKQPRVADCEEIRSRTDPVGWLEKNLKTDSTVAPEIIRLTLNGDHAEEIALILNAVTQAYLNEVIGQEREKQRLNLDVLQQNYRIQTKTLQEKKKALRELEITLGVDDEETARQKRMAAAAQLNTLEGKRLEAQLALRKAQQELKSLGEREGKAEVHVSGKELQERLQRDSAYQKLQERLSRAEELIVEYQKNLNPAVRSAMLEGPQTEKAAVLKQLKRFEDDARKRLLEELQTQAKDDHVALDAKLRDAIPSLKEQVQAYDDEIRRKREELKQLAGGGQADGKPIAELEALRNDVAQLDSLVKKMGDRVDLLAVEPPQPARVSVMVPAEAPQEKNQDRQLKLAGVGAFGAFALALCGVSYSEVRRRKIHTPRDVVQGLGLSLVGTVPSLPVRVRTGTPANGTPRDLHWQQRLNESVDAIRSQLLRAAQMESLSVVMVTSALGGEGKTSLACHLATSLARAWRKTLLIDCDLRNPGAHRLFDVPQEPGFSEVLRGEVEHDDAVKTTPVNRLWMIPAGNWDSHAVQALAQDGVRGIFDRLREQYDFIVIDSSPVLPVADALSLGQHVDGVLLAVLSDVSRVPTVQAANERLASLGIRVLGSVVLGARDEVAGLGYHYPRPVGG